jgi:phenylacetate-CoA oxygenase PaaJ subunit
VVSDNSSSVPTGQFRRTRGQSPHVLKVVTADAVWKALAEIPDPEIPVISLVDLGVIRDVAVDDGSVRVEFTPTFLGCPALEVMRDAMAERIRALGAEPEINVRSDDSWSTDRITPEGRKHLRPDPVPVAALLRQLSQAVRAVQDDLAEGAARPTAPSAHPLRTPALS